MDIAIKLENIKKSYGNNTILENFDLEIEKGEFVTVIGSSGCGKTTVLKIINGLISQDYGKVFINGKDTYNENMTKIRRSIGYVIQGNILFPHMNIEKNIAYVLNISNKNNKTENRKLIEKWIKIVGLDLNVLKRYPDELSGGQQQRVGIARAFLASPDIVLMDEPFSAVDEITRHQLQTEILNIHKKEKTTIFFITHDILEAVRLGTKVLVMNNGKIEQFSKPNDIIKNPKTEFIKKLVARIGFKELE